MRQAGRMTDFSSFILPPSSFPPIVLSLPGRSRNPRGGGHFLRGHLYRKPPRRRPSSLPPPPPRPNRRRKKEPRRQDHRSRREQAREPARSVVDKRMSHLKRPEVEVHAIERPVGSNRVPALHGRPPEVSPSRRYRRHPGIAATSVVHADHAPTRG